MARSHTENFPTSVIERLRNRVSLRCSNPDCRRATAAPGPGLSGVTLVGEAAHIHAASAGGARYLASMSPEERRSIDNALWLCSICHTNIDRNPDMFKASLLREWKQQAEASARSELGQRLPAHSDAQNLLLTAFTGSPTHLPRNAIANVVGASELQLQALDPRFVVRATYANGVTTHTIEALEPVRLSFKARGLAPDTLAGLRSMYEHGTPVTIAANQLTVDGSPLMAHIAELTAAEGGTLTMGPRELPALLKLQLSDPSTGQIRAFDDMPGTIQVGHKSVTFAGSNCAGILRVSFRKPFDDGAALTDGQFWADVAQWNGQDIRALPYLDKIVNLFKMVGEGWDLEFALEMQGHEFLRGQFNSTNSLRDYIIAMNTLLAYSIRARTVATHMKEAIAFRSDVSFTKEEHQAIGDAAEIFELKRVHGRDQLTENARCRLIPTDTTPLLLEKDSTPTEVMFRDEERKVIKIFNQIIQLPPIEICLKGVIPKVIGNRTLSTRKHSDKKPRQKNKQELQIEFEPADGYQCMIRYGSPIQDEL